MRRALVLDHLDRAEREVLAAQRQISEQIEFIAWMGWFGRDATGAKTLLREFEGRLARQIAERERLRAQLTLLNDIDASRDRQRPQISGVEKIPAFS
jgi:hypothetical protein